MDAPRGLCEPQLKQDPLRYQFAIRRGKRPFGAKVPI